MPPPDEKIVNEFQLEFQGTIPVSGNAEGESEYENLKIFLESINVNAHVDGQIVKFLDL